MERTKGRITYALRMAVAVLMSCASLFCMRFVSYGASWGTPGDINAGAAIVMDADTRAIIYGKNIHQQCYPASITKLMTALLVLENCSLDETVTFSERAVTDLEPGAVTAYISAGEQLTVEQCLYALLLESANDVANALAEHVAGSIEAFADMMNERARELGCEDTNFRNPSGLTDQEHVTTAYDMALIANALFSQQTFLEIESHDSYKLPATARVPSGLNVTIGHRMLRSGNAYSDNRVIGGKTGFTTASGNTLVTMAESGGRRLSIVVMMDTNPKHYLDTQSMMELGFSGFENVDGSEVLGLDALEERLLQDTVIPEGNNDIGMDRSFLLTLPYGADLSLVETDLEYNLSPYAPEDAVARLDLSYEDHTCGSYYVINDRDPVISIEALPPAAKVAVGVSAVAVIAGAMVFLIISGGAAYHTHNVREEERSRRRRAARRRRYRLESMGISEEQFEEELRRYKQRYEGKQREGKDR